MKKKETKRTQVQHKDKRLTCLMSSEDMKQVNRYLKHYHITNKSRWMRETLLSFIYRNNLKDYPTLFSEYEMRR